ncbi:MAG: bifunctional 3,4-dihydroxy-2-butanone-4-phosphate synthase/GTP cyclohydrolase II [Thiotrichales bacterium]|nr:MAG: bifunctional 3,4-dihydroxy-2-butanone-4-phosphate synthase/GTP cyclohydrolase II [Thiotrichales bacterium]
MNALNKVNAALDALRQGKMVVLLDDKDRENEGDVIVAAEFATPDNINFMISDAKGLVCVSLTQAAANRLHIGKMTPQNTAHLGTNFTVSVDAKSGITTGISSYDRAFTIKLMADEKTTGEKIVSPGHIFPIIAKDNGVLERNGHTEGSVDLMRLAGLTPMAVICEIINPDGNMARRPELLEFAKQHNLVWLAIADVIEYRQSIADVVEKNTHQDSVDSCIVQVSEARLPLNKFGEFQIKVFRDMRDNKEHVVLQKGEISSQKPCLARIHSSCLTGDLFSSKRCDCGWQLQAALEKISIEGGALLYLQQEGRGIGLANKVKAYALQDEGLDTVEANQKLGFSPDQREYEIAVSIFKKLGINNVRLLTNNPDKIAALRESGMQVVREEICIAPDDDNFSYLQTKKQKMGHLFS